MTRVEALRSKMEMPYLKLLFFFLLLISFNIVSFEVDDIPTYFDHNCTINNNFTSDSPYQFNLNILLPSLYSTAAATNTTFYNTTSGPKDTNNAVYGEYMCRGDVPMEVCQDCVQDATNRIASECPNNKDAIIWYDQCFLRYSHRSFFSTVHQLPTVSDLVGPHAFRNNNSGADANNGNNSRADANNGYIELNKTLNDAVAEAVASTKNFATKEANLSSCGSLYILVQCTPDLSLQFCAMCLYGLIKIIPSDDTVPGGRILNPTCNLRYQGERFYYKGNQLPNDSIFQEEVENLFKYNDNNAHVYVACKDNDNSQEIMDDLHMFEYSQGLLEQSCGLMNRAMEYEKANERLTYEVNGGHTLSQPCGEENALIAMLELNSAKWKGMLLGVIQRFAHADAFREIVYKFSIGHQFEFNCVKNSKHKMSVKCKVEGCPWKETTSAVGKSSPLLRVTKFTNEHIHSTQDNLEVKHPGRSSLTSTIIIDEVKNHGEKRPHEIRKTLQQDYGVKLTYKQAYNISS